jgi:hypothetical protein
MKRREAPIKRTNPSGREVWVARYTRPDGKRRSAGTYRRRHEAQAAIDAAYEAQERGAPETVGAYAETWTERHPRAARTNRPNAHRIGRVFDVEIEGTALRDWPFRELRRRHAFELVDHLLRVQGRAHTGAQNILRAVSAMAEDAITDEVAEVNFVRGVRVRANDPRVTGSTRPPRVFSFADMHAFAAKGGASEAMLRVFIDCGLRLGEVLGARAPRLRRRGVPPARCRSRRSLHPWRPADEEARPHGPLPTLDGQAGPVAADPYRHAAVVPDANGPDLARVELPA